MVPIVEGLITYLQDQLDANVWDGEVPRYDPQGRAINPTSGVTDPTVWPVVRCLLTEAGLTRNPNFESPYDDEGPIRIEVYGTSRAQVQTMLNSIEALLAKESNLREIDLGGYSQNPNYVISMILKSWTNTQEEGVRTSTGLLLYRGEISYTANVHGSLDVY